MRSSDRLTERRRVVLLVPRRREPLQQLASRIRLADGPSRNLIDDTLAGICTRLVALEAAGKGRQLEEWCVSGAWTEIALALVKFEFPNWTVRRLILDDGKWCCSLSRTPALPIEIDDVVECSHESMPLAILAALVEARRTASVETAVTRALGVVGERSHGGHRICCDNFV
jgi:hypothetical protein